ncbi:hypothetical protein M8J75_011941 [Diaphorina citri]|nr:hypothetical protein M8J75_011941 [Diaphorina citri]
MKRLVNQDKIQEPGGPLTNATETHGLTSRKLRDALEIIDQSELVNEPAAKSYDENTTIQRTSHTLLETC